MAMLSREMPNLSSKHSKMRPKRKESSRRLARGRSDYSIITWGQTEGSSRLTTPTIMQAALLVLTAKECHITMAVMCHFFLALVRFSSRMPSYPKSKVTTSACKRPQAEAWTSNPGPPSSPSRRKTTHTNDVLSLVKTALRVPPESTSSRPP